MAESMREIKRRIKSINSIEHITNAMKLVSVAKLRKAKAIFESSQEYLHYVTGSIEEIFHNTSEVPERYLKGNREIKRTCYVVITSCRGLCGSFNTNVIKEAEERIVNNQSEPDIVAIGTRGKEFFEKRGYNIMQDYLHPPENISFLETQDMSRPIIQMYETGKVDEVVLVYTSFISTMEQKVRTISLLPFETRINHNEMWLTKEVEYEPNVEEVFNYLVPKYVEIMIYGAIVESATCEHAARRMAMENATDNANEMIDDLTLHYNRARQAAITSEITEIVSGADALK